MVPMKVSDNLSKMNLKDQLLFIESYLPDAWEYLHDIAKAELPKFDENDEVVEEDKCHEGMHKSGPCA